MKKAILLTILVSLVALGGQAFAEQGTIDNVPAATLLIPRFEVDLENPGLGVNTLFSVNNASAAPIVAHVTVWSEWSVPVVDWDIYLTGYDVQTMNLADVFVNGRLPFTGAIGSNLDPSNTGAWSDPPIAFPGCGITAPTPPAYSDPAISPGFQAHIAAWLTGNVSPITGNCASDNYDDAIARGYITIDAVDECDTAFPGDVGYFGDNGTGIAVNDNVLWGDMFIVDVQNAFAQGWTAVHIEAFDGHVGAGNCVPDQTPQSFYCRYDPFGGDNREALGSKYATRFAAENDFFTGGTQLLSYRDPGFEGSPSTNSLCIAPDPFTEAAINVFDEEENPFTVVTGGPSGAPPAEQLFPFPRESNRTLVTNQQAAATRILNTGSFQFGWLFLNLNGAETGDESEKNQAYVLPTQDALGAFSVGYEAIQLNNLSIADTAPGTLEPQN